MTSKGKVPEEKVTCVEYPGIVRNVTTAISTLGGIKNIEKVESEKGKPLTLLFNENDSLGHPIFGDKKAKTGAILRITKNKNKKIKCDIISTIEINHSFKGLCDYSYSKPKLNAKTEWNVISSETIESHHQKQDEKLLATPPLFTKVDYPLSYAFKDKVNITGTASKHLSNFHNKYAKIRFHAADTVPKLLNLPKDADKKHIAIWNKLCHIFENRPILSESMLLFIYGNDEKREEIMKILPLLCYRFWNGPWKNLWIIRNYDPRMEKEAKKYQLFLYSLPQDWYFKRKDFEISKEINTGTINKNIDKINNFTCLPHTLHTYLQICDVEDDIIKNLVNEEVFSRDCTEKFGWFNMDTWIKISERLKVKFQELININDDKLSNDEKYIETNTLTSFFTNLKKSFNEENEKEENEIYIPEKSLVDEQLWDNIDID